MGNDNDNISTRLTYLLIGGGIGAVIALLFAPKSGQELRGDLADATRKGIDKSREAAQQLGEKAGEYYESGRERAGELYSQRTLFTGSVESFRYLFASFRQGWRSSANRTRCGRSSEQHGCGRH
jgi:gas vesicle protein